MPAAPRRRRSTTRSAAAAPATPKSVRITYDPRKVSYGRLLQIYFSVAHDPTELNRQGPDVGTQYRSTIFPANDAQAKVAKAYIDQLDQAHAFGAKIVTTIEPGRTFYPAEAYHQDYLTLASQPALHRHQRPAQGRQSQAPVRRTPIAPSRCWSARRACRTDQAVAGRGGGRSTAKLT